MIHRIISMIAITEIDMFVPAQKKNSMGNQSRPESRQESRSTKKESRIGSNPILFILLPH